MRALLAIVLGLGLLSAACTHHEKKGDPPSSVAAACKRTGCSSEVCSDQDVTSTCEARPEYACYKDAACERQPDGTCGFTVTPALSACLEKAQKQAPAAPSVQ